MCDIDQAVTFIRAFYRGISADKQLEVERIVTRSASGTPTRDQVKVLVMQHMKGIAEKANLPFDGCRLAEAVCDGLPLEAT